MPNSKVKKINSKGQGLVSVIVAAAIGAIVIGFLTDMLVQQGVGQKFLTQRLELNDLTNNLITTLTKPSNCTCQFLDDSAINPNHGNISSLRFNSTIIDGSQTISVKKIFSGCLGGVTPQLIVAENQRLSNFSGIVVDEVSIVNLRPTGGLNEWQGNWQISFQTGGSGLVRPVKPILISQKFNINVGSPYSTTSAAISSCVGGFGGSGTPNRLAKWSSVFGTLQDSGVFEDNIGRVGIGTSSPAVALDVNGDIKPGAGTLGAACTSIGSFAFDAIGNTPVFCNSSNIWTRMGGGACSGTLVDMYQCPSGISLGGGAWGYYGCQGQIQSQPTCQTIEWPSSQNSPCTYVGKMCLTP